MGRPISGPNRKGRFCPLGWKIGIESCVWGADDWHYLETGGSLLREAVAGLIDVAPEVPARIEYCFDSLPDDFQWLRTS